MKFKADKIRLQYNEKMQCEITLTTKEKISIDDLKQIIENGKELTAEIKQFRKHRSLDSNSYMWILLSKMASVLNTSKDELYLQALEDYGTFTHIVVKPEVVDKIKNEWRACRVLGEVTINGKVGVQIQCYFGSSTMDNKEMSTLINGIVADCKDMNIEVLTPRELELMASAWGKA
ncbi:hypothetical protein [Clostridium sp.]